MLVVLVVLGVVARLDRNVVIDATHPEFETPTASLHQPVYWDRRLLRS